jgi:putative flippase GtrA
MTETGDIRGRTLTRPFSLLRGDGVVGQGTRFVLSGAAVSVVYITITTLLSEASHLRFQLALAIGWCAAVSVHFTLQRTFVWSNQEEFALPFRHQVGRYLLLAVSQLGVSATTTTLLPSVVGTSAEVIYLATAVVLTLINFAVFRLGIFHVKAVDSSAV